MARKIYHDKEGNQFYKVSATFWLPVPLVTYFSDRLGFSTLSVIKRILNHVISSALELFIGAGSVDEEKLHGFIHDGTMSFGTPTSNWEEGGMGELHLGDSDDGTGELVDIHYEWK
tara:strand:- start:229 stop:576 length:348 start_codon:yes stop_codon:yes gene_type:complete